MMKNDYFESEEFKEILDKYQSSREHGHPCYLDIDDFADVADYYLNDGNAKEGLEAVIHGLELHPDSGLLQTVKSGILIYNHDYVGARELLDNLSDGYIDNDVYYQKAQLAYAHDKNIDEAEEMFREWIEREKAIEVENGNPEDSNFIRDSYIHVITSFIELVENHDYDPEIVKRWVEEYIVLFSPLGNNDADLLLADIVRDECLTDMVEKVYSLILETIPYAKYGWTVLAAAQNSNGRYQESNDSCDFALAINPEDWDAKLTKAHNYYSLQQYDMALPLFKELMDQFDDHSQSLAYSMCLISVGKIEEGKEQLGKAAEFAQSLIHSDTYLYGGMCYEMADGYLMCDDVENALKYIDKALEVFPIHPDCHLCKGTILMVKGEFDGAVESFNKCISLSDDPVDVSLNITLRMVYQGYDEQALSVLDNCYDNGTQYEKSWRLIPGYRAFVYFRLKKYSQFADELKIACEQCPEVIGKFFADYMPENFPPKDYYTFLMNITE